MSDKLKRRNNLSLKEKAALAQGVAKRQKAIFGNPDELDYASKCNRAWQEVTAEVNAVNSTGTVRTRDWLRTQFRAWKCRVKSKVAHNHKQLSKTGRGEASMMALTAADEIIAGMITNEEVMGIEGAQEVGFEDSAKEPTKPCFMIIQLSPSPNLFSRK